MFVSELETRFANANAQTIEVDLGDIEISDDASSLRIGSDLFLLDEQTYRGRVENAAEPDGGWQRLFRESHCVPR